MPPAVDGVSFRQEIEQCDAVRVKAERESTLSLSKGRFERAFGPRTASIRKGSPISFVFNDSFAIL